MLRDASGASVEQLTYDVHMWGGLAVVEEHAKAGQAHVAALVKELSARVSAQRDFAAGMKTLGLELSDQRIFEPSRKRGQNQEVEAEHLEKSAVAPLKKVSVEGSKELAQLVKKGQELKSGLDSHVREIESARESYYKLADAAELAQREHDYSEAFKLIDKKEKERIDAAYREKGPQAAAALKKYEHAVDEGNKAREQYIQFMRMLLTAHENLELSRLRAVQTAVAALYETDAGVAHKPQTPQAMVQLWIAEHQTHQHPPPPFAVVPYVPHHAAIPVPVFAGGELPTSPKSADVVRKQVMPVLLPVKVVLKQVHTLLSAASEPAKSPRGGAKFSPRAKKLAGDEAALVGPGDTPLQRTNALLEHNALLAKEASTGFEFVDLFAGPSPMVRHLKLPADDLNAMTKISTQHLDSNETQLLKIVYGQAVESRARGGKVHDVHTPMLLHVVYSFARDATADSWIAASVGKSAEWKASKKGKFAEREQGWERAEFISTAFFSEADLTFRLYKIVWRSKDRVVVEYMLRPDCDHSPSKWVAAYALRDELSEEARAARLENQPSVQTIKTRGHLVIAGAKVRAISDYEPEKDGVPRLKLAKGELLDVLDDDDGSGWLKCCNAKGARGLVPSNFVTLVK